MENNDEECEVFLSYAYHICLTAIAKSNMIEEHRHLLTTYFETKHRSLVFILRVAMDDGCRTEPQERMDEELQRLILWLSTTSICCLFLNRTSLT